MVDRMSRLDWNIEPTYGIGGVRLGESRDQVLEFLKRSHLEFDVDEDDSTWAELESPDIELLFDSDARLSLIQIRTSDSAIQSARNGPIVGKTLPEAINSLPAISYDEAMWKIGSNLPANGSTDTVSANRKVDHTAEEYLMGGTLWLRPLGVGLAMHFGVVNELILCQPQDVPEDARQPLTTKQLELATRDGLEDYLHRYTRARRSRLAKVATALLVVVVLVLAIRVAVYQKRVANAPTVEGLVTEVQLASESNAQDLYVVKYSDLAGIEHEAKLTLRDIYVPREPGETVQVTYFPESPAIGFGPAHFRDSSFLVFAPWFLGAFCAYSLALMLDCTLCRK